MKYIAFLLIFVSSICFAGTAEDLQKELTPEQWGKVNALLIEQRNAVVASHQKTHRDLAAIKNVELQKLEGEKKQLEDLKNAKQAELLQVTKAKDAETETAKAEASQAKSERNAAIEARKAAVAAQEKALAESKAARAEASQAKSDANTFKGERDNATDARKAVLVAAEQFLSDPKQKDALVAAVTAAKRDQKAKRIAELAEQKAKLEKEIADLNTPAAATKSVKPSK